MHLRQPRTLDRAQRRFERGVVLGREADDHVARQVELARDRLEPAEVRVDRVPPAHRVEHAVVARLQRHVEVLAHGRRLAQGGNQLVVDVIDLDRAETQPLEPRRLPRLAHEPRQVVARRAVAEAAKVDAGQDDLAVSLLDSAPDLVQNRARAAAARGAAHEWDDAEVARERAAVLDLHERAHAVDPRVGLDAADRADVTRDERRSLLAALRDDGDVLRQAGECVEQVRAAAGDVDTFVQACGPRCRLAALRDGLVGDAARADHGDVGAGVSLVVAVAEQRLAHLVHVGVADLAAEEVDAERRHARDPKGSDDFFSRPKS